jgi:PAS domain S-box-containing protein
MQTLNPAPIPLIASDPMGDAYYRTILELLPTAVYTCDADGCIKWYNKAAADLWGRHPEVGKDLWCGSWKIFTADGDPMPPDQCPMAKTLKEKRAVAGEEIIVERPDGERRHVLPSPQPVFNEKGELVGALNTLLDVTQHKKNQELAEKLRASNEQLEQFAYAASHDLQEPLRKIQTFVNLIGQKPGQVDPSIEKYLQKISEASNRMSQLIEALLQYTRFTKSGELSQATDLNEVVHSVLDDLDLLVQQKEALIRVGRLPIIRAVPAQMNQLFYNLFNNALKFSKENVRPEISLSATVTPMHVQVVLSDNGIGFEQQYAEKIFGMFERLNDKYSYPGTGIGLSLCRKVVENHKGSIWAESEKDKGTTFYIQFPASILVSSFVENAG